MVKIDKIKIFENFVDNLKEFNNGIPARNDEELAPPISKKKKKTREHEKKQSPSYSDLEVVIGIYKLLTLDFKKYSNRWRLDSLTKRSHQDCNSEDDKLVKWFSLEISSLVLSMTPEQNDKYLRFHFTHMEFEELTFKFNQIIVGDEVALANKDENNNHTGGVHPTFRTNFSKQDLESYRRKAFKNEETVTSAHQHSTLMDVDGKPEAVVLVETTKENLDRLEMSITTDNCIIVEGSLSCGKTTLIEHLAKTTQVKLIKYQMDDFMDSKALIGSYICSDVPGEFMWKPGPLFSAVSEDCWLLLEDFDNSPVDSLSLLIDLLETKSIKSIANTSIELGSNFRLFLTVRTGLRQSSNLHFIESIKKLGRSVTIHELNELDIKEIICRRYPKFYSPDKNKVIDIVLDICHSLQMFDCLKGDLSSSAGGVETSVFNRVRDVRHLSLRDLLKLFERFNAIRDTEDRRMIMLYLQDIYDCFLSSIQSREVRAELIVNSGYKFQINREEVQSLLINSKPSFEKKLDEITCGRVKLSIKAHSTSSSDSSSLEAKSEDFFVYTKSSLKLLEQVARCIECNEPVLLCGETGVGKTSSLQHLARLLDKKINVINLSQQTETGDLLGSYKPVDVKSQMKILKEKFLALFSKSFNEKENQTFLNHIQKCYKESNWQFLLKLLLHATNSAYKKFMGEKAKKNVVNGWREFRAVLNKINDNYEQMVNKFSFQFFEGVLTKAIVNGEWVILDEINLASPETLQFLTPLLDNNSSEDSHIILYEKGSTEPLVRHPGFRLFGAMNPASDIGKRNLPINIRNRFTEIYVEELDSEEDLIILVKEYLHTLSNLSPALVQSVVHFYLGLKSEEFARQLLNGVGVNPNYSLRTLCRALKNAANNYCNNTIVSVYDGICLSFLTDLNRESSAFLENHIRMSLFKSAKTNMLAKIMRKKPKAQMMENFSEKLDYIDIEDYWILKGPNEIPDSSVQSTSYIFTKSIQENLKRLVRVCSAQLPCLIQGDTSIGKTSLVKWLAQATGNVLIRINNHDHTDLQEYIGSYVIEPSGKLVFKEGLLAKAMRHGYWILLDELNLASSEVLEALNRVLDDNRELFIPETQEVIKAHPRFVLFATQNPPGKYAGRKQLSRAFRNRFIELHFDELPEDELQVIVEKKCRLPASYAKLLIKTVTELKTKRSQSGGIFLGKHSLITLRDLFRWANRFSNAEMESECSDWKHYLAEQGLLILTSRCRSMDDVRTIHSCIEKVFAKRTDIENLTNPQTFTAPIMKELNLLMAFSLEESADAELRNFVWTASAKRTALLAGMAYKFNEPFLLVGETGIGKTTICQILAMINNKSLNIVNCHMHSEAADFLGSIRPVRSTEVSKDSQLFEWQDGPLVVALREGQDFLIDEISLADDSVLERLNSVLEEERTLLVAENASSSSSTLVAHPRFRIFSTMNPGGDFGKKELSAALRNRFTEIWCPTPTQESEEFEVICHEKLKIFLENTPAEVVGTLKDICKNVMCSFLRWLSKQAFFAKKSMSGGTISIRDLMRWIRFINNYSHSSAAQITSCILNPVLAMIHGAHLVFIDALNIESGSNSLTGGANPSHECVQFLFETLQDCFAQSQVRELVDCDVAAEFNQNLMSIRNDEKLFGCGPFLIEKNTFGGEFDLTKQYCLSSRSTMENLQRIMRCLLMDNPIMLEGSPGVGKTSIIETLGKLTRNKVVRINLSEQTDLSELFGADLPASEEDKENSTQVQKFCWRDGPFLLALKQGNWIILDEINLASQSVLEGLNSCFDHRGEVYVTELNRKFLINKTSTKIFACQNPYLQGGGRKGLPKSFLNRFSKVYVNKMSNTDLLEILKAMYSDCISVEHLASMIQFNEKLNQEVLVERLWGGSGAPWEFNLRDMFRWCELLVKNETPDQANPGNYVFLLYASRFRTAQDRSHVMRIFSETFGYEAYQQNLTATVRFTKTHLQIGQSFLKYPQAHHLESNATRLDPGSYAFTDMHLAHLESIIKCLEMNWMVILVGTSCVGKTSLIRMVADLMNQSLVEFPVNNATDTSDLLGGFNKIEHEKLVFNEVIDLLKQLYQNLIKSFLELKEKRKGNKEKLQMILDEYIQFQSDIKSQMPDMLSFLEAVVSRLAVHVKTDKHLKFLACQLTDISVNLEQIKQRQQASVQSKKKKMNFEWIDSSLVNAIENGEWLLIDNANFCSPSVLDRLNPLLEPNGLLQINEKGIGENGVIPTVEMHKNFRMILCMNESFGELSRPMRNRGVELYLNDLNPTDCADDEKIILKSLYSIPDEEFEFFYERIVNLHTDNNRFKKLGFTQILKVFKLIHDFWLVESQLETYSAEACLQKALAEYQHVAAVVVKKEREDTRLEMEQDEPKMEMVELTQQQKQHHYYADTFKLKEFLLYRYMFNFPLHASFVQQLRGCFLTAMPAIDIKNYFELFIESVRMTQMVEIWLRNVSVGSASNIMKLLNDSLSDQRLTPRYMKEKIYSLFEQVALKTFSSKSNELYKNFISVLNEMASLEKLDLQEETLDLSQNTFLCQKLSKQNRDKLDMALSYSRLLKLEIIFNLSKYRMNKFYQVQDDSLLTISKSLDSVEDSMEHDTESRTSTTTTTTSVLKSSFKFLSLFEEFYNQFTIDIMTAVSQMTEADLTVKIPFIKSTIYLFEKFYLVCASRFDAILTSSYLKYYWSFLATGLNAIQGDAESSIWSAKFQSYVKLFDQHLFYDNSVFEAYRSLWASQRPRLSIHNKEQLELCGNLNQKLVHLSSVFLQQSNYESLQQAIQHLNNSSEINERIANDYTLLSDRLDQESLDLATKTKFDCCHESSSDKIEYDDFLDELNSAYLKSQTFPVYYFAEMVREFDNKFSSDSNQFKIKERVLKDDSKKLTAVKSLTHMVTKHLALGKFSFLFDQSANRFVNFLRSYQSLLKIGLDMDKIASEQSSFAIDTTVETKTSYLINELKNTYNSTISGSIQELNNKSILHYNWLNEYLLDVFFNNLEASNQSLNKERQLQSYSTSVIKLKLCHFDLKLTQLNNLNSFIWENYSVLSSVHVLPEMETSLLKYLNENLDNIKATCFNNNEDLFRTYLEKRNFNSSLYTLRDKLCKSTADKLTRLFDIMIHGCVLACMFAPCDPLDPFEYEILVKKCQEDEEEISRNEQALQDFNAKNRLRACQFSVEPYDKEQINPDEFYAQRENQSDYFFIKNEIENALKQFCSQSRLGRLIEDLFHVYAGTGKAKKTASLVEDEYKIWINSLERLTEKLANTFYSYSDVIYLPLNGLALVGYGVKALYTSLKSLHAQTTNASIIELVNYLYTFPYNKDHTSIAEDLLEFAKHMSEKPKLNDELCLLALQHLFNSLRCQSLQENDIISNTSGNRVLLEVCQYFNQRYRIYNEIKAEEAKVETFKYKEYGQKEIQQELDDKEMAESFPSFVSFFEDFNNGPDLLNDVDVNTGEDGEEPQTTEDQVEFNEALEKKNLVDFKFLVESYDLIDKFYEFYNTDLSVQNNQVLFENVLLNTFYSSYSIGSSIVRDQSIDLPNTNMSDKNSLLSHIMFTTSINHDTNKFNIVYEKNQKNERLAYNIYRDPNHSEVIRSRKILTSFKTRIIELLRMSEFESNPILLELKKIIKRIESFDLNDPLMKFVTGLELLYQKSEAWQLIGGKMYTIEPETRLINTLIVDWRKMELTFWQKSLDNELEAIRRKNGHVWFNHVFAICAEFMRNEPQNNNENEFFDSLKLFVEYSSFGDYFIRLRQLKICYRMFELSDKENKNRESLLYTLWNVYNYFDVLFSQFIQDNLKSEKVKIEKELKEFIQICRWQDFNYWALKSSTTKFTTGVFKIVRKFRVFLRGTVDLGSLITKNNLNRSVIIQDKKLLNPKELKLSLKQIGQDVFTDEQSANTYFNRNYYLKMKKLCKDTLVKKCIKTNINESLSDFTESIYNMFCSIDKEANSFMATYQQEKNKETTAKYKKDIKGLVNQKAKYISDLMKNLAFIGLSYRRGNLQYASDQSEAKEVVVFEPCVLTSFNKTKNLGGLGEVFKLADFNYYLCVDRFFEFRVMMNSKQQAVAKDLNTVPVEKFRGYIEHLFQIIYRQKGQLHGFLNQLNSFNILSDTCQFITNANSFDSNNLHTFKEIKAYCTQSLDIIRQIELFFTASQNDASSSEISISYEAVKEKLTHQKTQILTSVFEINKSESNDLSEVSKLNQNFKFMFTDSQSKETLSKLSTAYDLGSEFNDTLASLNELFSSKCSPFTAFISEMSDELIGLSERLSGMEKIEGMEPDLDKIQELTGKVTYRILKAVETLFKKSVDDVEAKEHSDDLFSIKSRLIDEASNNFKTDLKTFDLESINGLLKTCLSLIEYTKNLDQLKEIIFPVTLFCQLYLNFLTKWATYLMDNHKETCKCFYALLYIFTELKTKGFSLPDDFDEEEADETENKDPNRKFELDNNDEPAGLADNEEGKNDVSDQIENEDQLDDAKKKGDEGEEEEEKEKPPIEENENGIEMSDDFEADLNDPDDKEQKEEKKDGDDEDDGVDEMEDLEDQKGDVDDDEQVLDEKLWDEEAGDGNDESEEELDTLDQDDNPNKQHDKKQELAAKDADMQDENKEDESEEPKQEEGDVDVKDVEDKEADDDEEKDEAENEKSQKINEQDDVDNNDESDGENADENKEVEDSDEKVNDKEPKPEEVKDTEDGDVDAEEENKDDIDMKDQEEDENDKESEGEQEQERDDKKQLDEMMPEEEAEEEEEEEKSSANVDDKTQMPISERDLLAKQEEQTNNSRADQNNAMCEEKELDQEDDKENNEDNDMNSVQDKISDTNQGKLGNQKSQHLDKIQENNRKKIGSKNEDRVVSEEKDKLVENFNLIEIDEKINEESGPQPPENKDESAMEANANNDLRHIQNENEAHDQQIYDAATDEQKREKKNEQDKETKVENNEKKADDKSEAKETSDKMDLDKEIVMDVPQPGLEELKSIEKDKSYKAQPDKDEEAENVSDDPTDPQADVKQEPNRPNSFYAHSKENLIEYSITRDEVESDLKKFRELKIDQAEFDGEVTAECLKLWQEYESLTQQMSKELCEQLRLILEPTVCSKLKGDYKSGKRLNMKRVIEYIATEYRKDKIWLRRIKPNKRDYQVMLAIDNSASMGDNHCAQLAYETIATLMNAFNYLEVGQLGLLKFGEKVCPLHDLQTNFHSDDGAKIISQIDFKDETTKIAEMLNVSTSIFSNSVSRARQVATSINVSKLLIILSDGRGIFYEGMETVKNSIRMAMQEQIFIVFVLLETPNNKSSIYDIKMPIFTDNSPIPVIKSYMEQFPFPFYVVLKDVNNLPNMIGEALKEWFDMVARLDS